MAIPTSRAKEKGEIRINREICTGCGECVEVCKDFGLVLRDSKADLSDKPVFGCIGCGHCMAICPTGAIQITGRTISPDDLFEIPAPATAAGYEQMMSLFRRRRSIREFRDKAVEPEIIQKILDAAVTSPMGLPPSDVNVLVLDSKEKTRRFAADYCIFLERMSWFVSPIFLALMRPFWGKSNDEMYRSFIKPMFDIFTGYMKKGINVVTYDAPLTIYFYGSPFTDPADPIVAATTAMYAGESLGLGTCMLGAVHPMIQYGRSGRRFRVKHGIKYASREGVIVIFGYPSVEYRKGIRRTFASTTFME
ncbi:MAG: nitroreductase family protein [Bacteroidales bacterium]|jgi:ferredoxin|nr:nitroreductase family protein [Bacteroidales bacterium]MBP7037140.1 nitroreductase family protein [Bacteroidales bacterium]HMT66525.1 nitroreductase family protein [Bacteroidales bacterium]